MLSKEVAHRAKNQLAVIQSIASRSLQGDVSLDDARKAFVAQYTIEGPEILVRNAAVQPLALLLHELATNAPKYGALAHADGDVKISWSSDWDDFKLSWIETWDMPQTAQPDTKPPGFGTLLVQRLMPSQLSGQATQHYADAGLQYSLTCPIAAIAGPENPQF